MKDWVDVRGLDGNWFRIARSAIVMISVKDNQLIVTVSHAGPVHIDSSFADDLLAGTGGVLGKQKVARRFRDAGEMQREARGQ